MNARFEIGIYEYIIPLDNSRDILIRCIINNKSNSWRYDDR